MEYKGLILDKFQEDAIHAIEHNKSVVVSAPTGSGKTLIADYIINRDIKQGIKVIYTAPIKALSNQKYKQFCEDYGEENVGLLTGDIVKNPSGKVLIMTTEIYRNMTLSNDDIIKNVSYVVFDEIHYINDIERGVVWEESIIFSRPHVRMLCLSATIPNAKELANWIEAIKGHKVEIIRHEKRAVPLHIQFYDAELGVTTLDKIKEVADIPDYKYLKGRSRRRRPRVRPPSHIDLVKEISYPCIFFNFSRHGCQKKAFELFKKRLFKPNPEISGIVSHKLTNPDINKLTSTKILRQTLPFGIGFHHAGLLPVIKELVEELFEKGLIKVLYTTETFAVGINMPAKTVCFESLRKFDGRGFRLLNSKEFFQIAGRAGRRGIDTQGFVYSMINRLDFEYQKMKKLTSADTDPIVSQFKLSVNTVLNLIKFHDKKEIEEILCKSLHSYQQYGAKFDSTRNYRSHNAFDKLKKKLTKLGYIFKDALTEKGEFTSFIYSDELILGEIFGTDFYKKLNEFQILLIIACVCYEPRERTQFYQLHVSDFSKQLKQLIQPLQLQLGHIDKMTALVHPCYYGKSIFDIFKNTNLLEGDVIRFFRQVVDRLGQIKNASKDETLRDMVTNCSDIILKCLESVDDLYEEEIDFEKEDEDVDINQLIAEGYEDNEVE